MSCRFQKRSQSQWNGEKRLPQEERFASYGGCFGYLPPPWRLFLDTGRMRHLTAFFLLAACALAPSEASARIVISEVMWMGSDLSTADEWIEIASDDPPEFSQSLSGWTITSLASNGTEAVIARFGRSHQLQGGSYGIISNYTPEASRLGIAPLLVSTLMSLPNTKLRLRLKDASGALADEVDDGIGAPFAGVNVSGQPKASMERLSFGSLGTDASNWKSAVRSIGFDEGASLLGTPGQPREASLFTSGSGSISIQEEPSIESKSQESFAEDASPVFVSEVLPDAIGDDALGEWIELQNAASQEVSLAGWRLKVGTHEYAFPAGSKIGSGGFLLVPRSQSKLTLLNGGDAVSLLNPAGRLMDSLTYGALPEGVSAGRFYNASDTISYCSPTPTAANRSSSPSAEIQVQQGALYGIRKLSLNVQAQFPSTQSAMSCRWDFGDGTRSESCNPPSHTYASSGAHLLTLSATDYCSNTVLRSLEVFVADTDLQVQKSCRPSTLTGITISEFLPSPLEGQEEWIELYNSSSERAELCGWSLDDGEAGSRPFRLEGLSIEPQSFFLLPGRLTKLSLNNDGDSVRLFGPLVAGGTGILLDLRYETALKGVSYVLKDGKPYPSLAPTPGFGNRLLANNDPWKLPLVVLRSALPNPIGKDPGLEWIEIENLSGRPQWMKGWSLQSGSSQLPLQGMVLSAGESRRIYTADGFSLRNQTGALVLASPTGNIASILAWDKAPEGTVIEAERGTHVSGIVTEIKNGVLTVQPEQRLAAPYTVRIAGILGQSFVARRMIENREDRFVSALILDEKVDLYLYSNTEGETVASIEKEGRDIASYLIMEGVVAADEEAVKAMPILMAYQAQALRDGRGLWSDAEQRESVLALQQDWKMLKTAKEKGYRLKIAGKSGIVSSGAVVSFDSAIPSTFFVSLNGAPYHEASSHIVIQADTKLSAYAVPILASSRAEIEIKTPIEERIFLTAKDSYSSNLRVSEIYPSPKKGEQEWIEIYNASDEAVSIGGWKLAQEEGKAKELPLDLVIGPREYKVLTSVITHLKLKNDGGGFHLLSPDGMVAERVRYPKIKSGYSYVFNIDSSLNGEEKSNAGCISTLSTPMAPNQCKPEVKKVKKSKVSKAKKPKAAAKASSAVSTLDPAAKALFASLEDQVLQGNPENKPKMQNTTVLWTILIACLGTVCFIILYRFRRRLL
jgi:PKD repeat protein